MNEKMSISQQMLEGFSKEYQNNLQNKLMANAIVKSGINNVAMSYESVADMHYDFSEEIDVGEVTNQKKSGRCWMFAALNNIRYSIAKKLNIKDKKFELSQAYTMFWDKLEKANYFLENIIETRTKDIMDRNVMWLLESPMNDGGQWDMFVGIVEKYGVMPKYAMPETFHSSDSSVMNEILNLKLRKNAKILRDMNVNGKDAHMLREKKEEMMKEFYVILCRFFGEPSKKFDFEYRDENNKFHSDRNITPLEFYQKYSEVKMNDYVSIINAPTKDKPFNKTYTVRFLGTVKGGNKIHYLNLEIEKLKELTIAQLKDGEPVWFGCDVGKMFDRELGIMDTALYDYEGVLNTKFNLSKADRLNYGISVLTHAMVFTGVNLSDSKPSRWKVQNSWGDKPGQKGFFIMSDNWFEEFNYEVVINKKYLSKELLEAYEQEPIELAPWDPFGSLA